MARLVSSESLKCSRIELMITNWYSFSPIEWQLHELNIFFTKWYQISRCASSFHHLKVHIHQMTDFTKWIFTKWFHQGAFTRKALETFPLSSLGLGGIVLTEDCTGRNGRNGWHWNWNRFLNPVPAPGVTWNWKTVPSSFWVSTKT